MKYENLMMQVNLIQHLEDQLGLLLQKARQSYQGWAKGPTSLPVGLPQPQRVTVMPFLHLRHRCSRGGCTLAKMNMDAL